MTLLGLAILATVSLAVGRLLAAVSRLRWLDRTHPDVLPLHAALGTALLMLVCAATSHAGLGQRHALWVVVLVVVALAVAARRRRSPPAGAELPRRPRLSLWAWLPFAVALAVVAFVGLLPIWRYHSINPCTDAFYYDAVSDWLVEHGVDELAPRLTDRPPLTCVENVQASGVRLGSSYLQAALTAATSAPHALLVFYAVSVWGLLLLAGCVYALARSAFRLAPWLAAAAMCTLVAVPSGAVHALQTGFQAQLYGLAALLTVLAVGAHLLRRPRRPAAACVLLGGLLAWQSSAYSELLPVTTAALAAWMLVAARRRRPTPQRRQWTRAVALGLIVFAALGNLEIERAVRGLILQSGAVVGAHIELSLGDWLGLFFGSTTFPPLDEAVMPLNPLALTIGPVVPLLLCLLGLLRRRTRRLAAATLGAAAVLAGLVVYFVAVSPDPWSGERPHTWSLYKLAEWSQPLVVVGAWAGAGRWLRSRRAQRLAAAFAVLLVGAGLPRHEAYASVISFWPMRVFTGSDRPLDELERLSRGMAQLSRRPVYVVTRPHLTDPGFVELLGYFTIHGRATGLWTGCPYIYHESMTWLAPERTDRAPPEVNAVLVAHRPHFEIPGAMPIGAQVVAVEVSDEPVLCQVGSPYGLRVQRGRPLVWLGDEPSTLVVFAPRAGRLRVDFLSHFGKDAHTLRHLEIRSAGRTEHATIDIGVPGTQAEVGFGCDVEAGLNEILVRCSDPPVGEGQEPLPDGRVLQLTFSRPRVAFEGP